MIPYIDYDLCEDCGACAEVYPDLFGMRDGKAWVTNHENYSDENNVEGVCPFRAIWVE